MSPLEYLLRENVSGSGEGLLGNQLKVRGVALWSFLGRFWPYSCGQSLRHLRMFEQSPLIPRIS